MERKIQQLLFKLDPEKAHDYAETFIRCVLKLPLCQDIAVKTCVCMDERLENKVMGLDFYNPIGLAAGFDKNATMIQGISALGFGFLEIGSVTKNPQSGNSKPRLFRFVEEMSLQNNMGMNNQGARIIAKRVAKEYPFILPLGINIGKNKDIENEDALSNYEDTLKKFKDIADYFTFNLSCPNVDGFNSLQNEDFVKNLLKMARTHTNAPLLIKISPDLGIEEANHLVESGINSGVSGIIIANTSQETSLLNNPQEKGGISGKAISKKSSILFEAIAKNFFHKTTLIASGGIMSAQDAYERILHGASAVQVWSGFVYGGIRFVKQVNKGILEYLQQDGFSSIKEAIGARL